MLISKEEKTTVSICKLGVHIEVADYGDGFINIEIKDPHDKVRLCQPLGGGDKYYRALKTFFKAVGTSL